jgi:hypothetical protein
MRLLRSHFAQPPEVQDLKSWLKMYGEPSPDKIPTGFLTTFRASKKVMAAVANTSAHQPFNMNLNESWCWAEIDVFAESG